MVRAIAVGDGLVRHQTLLGEVAPVAVPGILSVLAVAQIGGSHDPKRADGGQGAGL